MKKKIIIVLSFTLICTLSACGIRKEESSVGDNTKQENIKITDTTNDETKQQPEEQVDTNEMDGYNTETQETSNETDSYNTETQKTSNDFISVAQKELTSILDRINNDVTTGTAGCKMTTVSITSDLLNWGVGTELSNDQIRTTVLNWLMNKGNDEAVAFSEKMSLVDETYHELLGENAKELLDSAGCENAAYPWSDEPIETIETIMDAVGLRD